MNEQTKTADGPTLDLGTKRKAYAVVKNLFGAPIYNVELKHRYDDDVHESGGPWPILQPQQYSDRVEVTYWTGVGRTGKDYWWIRFDYGGATWTCKTNFYCFLTADDEGKNCELRPYDDNGTKMMVVAPHVSSNCYVHLDQV